MYIETYALPLASSSRSKHMCIERERLFLNYLHLNLSHFGSTFSQGSGSPLMDFASIIIQGHNQT